MPPFPNPIQCIQSLVLISCILESCHVADDGKINTLSHVMEGYSESSFSTLLEHVTTLHGLKC